VAINQDVRESAHTGVVVLGCNEHAQNTRIPALLGAGARIVAVADLDPVNAAAAAGRIEHHTGERPAVYPGADALFAHPAADLAVIVTPTPLHHEHVLAALRAGLHALVEKPAATSLRQAREMLELALDVGRQVHVGYQKNYALPDEVRELIARGLGTMCLTLEWHRPPGGIPDRPGFWTSGAMLDLGSHLVALLCDLELGAPSDLFASLCRERGVARFGDRFTADDGGVAHIRLESGVLATIDARWDADVAVETHRLVAAGTRGTLVLPLPLEGRPANPLLRQGGRVSELDPARDTAACHRSQMHDVLGAVRGERFVPWQSRLLAPQAVLEAIRRSAETRGAPVIVRD
jgi:predicted dehydrogenase